MSYFHKDLFILLIGCIYIVNCCTNYKRESKVSLLNNGYENILIAIEDDIKESRELIDRIQTVFTDTSRLLFNATKYGFS